MQHRHLPVRVYRTIQYTVRHMRGLPLYPLKIVLYKQEVHGQRQVGPETVVRALQDRRQTPGGFQRRTLGTRVVDGDELTLRDLRSVGMSAVQGHNAFGHGGQLRVPPGRAWHHHCSRVECYHFANWVRTRLGLGQDLKIVHVERTLRFLTL